MSHEHKFYNPLPSCDRAPSLLAAAWTEDESTLPSGCGSLRRRTTYEPCVLLATQSWWPGRDGTESLAACSDGS